MFLLHFSNRNSLITHCTHSEEEDTSSMSVNKVIQKWLLGEGVCGLDAGSLCSKDALQNAGIKSTQLMPLQVNTTHTMGVDVIDKTVGGRSIDTKSLEWRGFFIHWRTCSLHKTLWILDSTLQVYWHYTCAKNTGTVDATGHFSR